MRRTRVAGLLVIGVGLWTACSDSSRDALGPTAAPPEFTRVTPDLRAALAAQERHTAALLQVPGVVGTAVGLSPDGKPTVRLLLAQANVKGLPLALDGVPVTTEVTGMFLARSDPTTRQRPAPLGFSLGHPAITAGSIGGRVVDASGAIYVLSNNHVLANSNDAGVGDPELQPGPFDGGTAPADQIGTLAAFKPINFSGGANTIDAAIAVSSADMLSNATPADEGYGLPNSAIYGDANGDGVFDNESALLGLAVQKYGRTTKATHGQITGINATVTDEVRVLIASSAVMLVFGRPGWEYTDLPEILVYPAAFDEDYRCATRHEFVGRLVPRNAIVLSRPALIRSFRQEAPYHVGLHEFAHLLDLEDDRFDGVPRGLDLATRRRWQGLVESELARARRGDSVLDDYARTNEVELFAVAVEWFFKAPRRLRARHRELYDSLAEYLGQEPAGSR